MEDEYLTLLKVDKKPKQQAGEDKVEFEITYLEAKDDKLIKSSRITISLGQMIVLQLLCKKFLKESLLGWNLLSRK